jgi:hypothetical protein
MKSIFALLFAALLLPFMMGGCDKPVTQGPAPDEKALFQTIEDNAQAFNKKDVDGVMATVHPKMPHYGDLKEFMAQTFKEVTLKVTVSNLKVVTSSPEEARVSFKQQTEKVADTGAVPLNIVEGIHTLRPDNGKWKIIATTNTNVVRLDQNPIDAAENTTPAPEPAPSAAPTRAPEASPAPAEPTAKPAPQATPAPPAEKPAQ